MRLYHSWYTLWIDIMGMSHPTFRRCLFVPWIELLYMCRNHWCSQSTTAPINQCHLTQSCFFLFPLINSSAAVIRSVYFPHAGLSYVGHWLECTKWVTDQPLGSTEVQWSYCWKTLYTGAHRPCLAHGSCVQQALLVFLLDAFFHESKVQYELQFVTLLVLGKLTVM